ncbi:ATP-binding protein [Desulfobulbus sp. US1]|nr:ATP-binding protein [Desulfobulbus sp. US1]
MLEKTSDLLKQIALGEDSILELKNISFKGEKISGPHRNGMADELAAMANTHAGIILLGVDDRTREVVGIPPEKLDLVEDWLRAICNDLIEPPLDCLIRKLSLSVQEEKEKVIIRIDVPRSLFVHQSPGGYFRRIGSSKRQMKPDMLARLFSSAAKPA